MTDCVPTRRQDCTGIYLKPAVGAFEHFFTWLSLNLKCQVWGGLPAASVKHCGAKWLLAFQTANFVHTFMFSQLHHMHRDTQTQICMQAQKQIYICTFTHTQTKLLPQLQLHSNVPTVSYSWLCWLFYYTNVQLNTLQLAWVINGHSRISQKKRNHPSSISLLIRHGKDEQQQ